MLRLAEFASDGGSASAFSANTSSSMRHCGRWRSFDESDPLTPENGDGSHGFSDSPERLMRIWVHADQPALVEVNEI